MTRPSKIFVIVGTAAAALVAVLAIAAVLVVRTEWFRDYVKRTIITATENGTGGKVEIGSYAFDWTHLRSTITDFVVHGEEPPGAPPYLRADQVQLDVRLFTNFHHLLDVTSLVIDRPQANILVLPNGQTNVPTPKIKSESKKTPLETVVDLAVGRFVLNRGRITLASQKHDLNIQGNNLRVQLAFNALSRGYQGTLEFEPVYVASGRNMPVKLAVKAPLSLRRDRIELQNATISTPQSSVAMNGSLEDLRDPKITAQVQGRIAVADLKNAANLSVNLAPGVPQVLDLEANATASGNAIQVSALHLTFGQSTLEASGALKDKSGRSALAFQGKLALGELGRLGNVATRPDGVVFLSGTASLDVNNDYRVRGNIRATNVSLQQGSRRIGGLNLLSGASLDPHMIALNDFRLSVLGGEIQGDASLQEFARYQVRGKVRNFGLPAAARAVGYTQLAYNGIVNGSFDAAGDLKAHGSEDLNAQAKLSIAPAGAKGIPVTGKVNASYRGVTDDLVLDNSYIALPHTRVTLDGSVKKQLQTTFSSTDLNDVFAATASSKAPVAFNGGRVIFGGTVTGGLSSPRITGHLSANRFQIQGRQFDKLDADAALSRSGAAVRNGSLSRESMQAQFSAQVGLVDWKALPNQALSADVSMQNADLADVVALSGRESGRYSGMLTAAAHVTGTVGNPRGTANLQAVRGTLEGQPFDRIQAQLNLTDQRIAIPNASLETSAGRADLAVEFQHPRDRVTTGQLHVHLQSTGVDLAKLAALQQRRPNTAGFVQFDGDVTGTLSDRARGAADDIQFLLTNVTSEGSVRGLRVEGQNYGDLILNARTNGDTVSYNVTSDFAGSNLKLTGNTKLAPGYPSNVDANLRGLPVERVLALAHRTDIRAKGNLSGAAHLSGTLDRPQGEIDVDLVNAVLYDEPVDRLRARVNYRPEDIDIQQLQISAGPSHVDATARYTHPQDTWQAGDFQIRVNSGRIDLSRIQNLRSRRPGLGGILQVTANGSGQIQTAEPRLCLRDLNADVKANGITAQGTSFGDASVTASTSAGKLNVVLDSNLAMASIHGQGSATLAGDYPIEAQLGFTNVAWTRVRSLLHATQEPLGFEAVADGQITAHGPALKTDLLAGSLQLTKLQLTTTTKAPRSQGLLFQNQGPIAATLDRGVVSIQSARVTGPQTDIQVSGTAPLHGPGLNVRVNGNANLALLRSFSPDIESSGGVTMAATIQGAAIDPRVTGQIELHDGAVSYAGFGNGLAKANGIVQFNGNAAAVRNLTAESGGGQLTLAGFVALRDGVRFGLRANASKVRVRLEQGVSVVADGNVNLTGTAQSGLLSGTVNLERISYAPQTDLASLLGQAPTVVETGTPSYLDNLKLDVRIRSSASTTVQSALSENLSLDADLQVRGTGSHPGVLGRITFNEGRLALFGSTYTVDSGTIGFYNPGRVEPILDLNMETEAKGVTVTLRVSGPMDNLKLSYTSDPPLQFQEIVSLLAAGTTPTSDPTLLAKQPQPAPQSFQQMGESALLGRAVADPIANRLQRVFGVSQLKIDPSFTSGSDVPQATLALQQRIANNITFTYVSGVSSANAQTIRVEWTFNQQWAATAMRDQNGMVSVNLVYKYQVR